MLLFTPLIFVFAAQSRVLWRDRILTVALPTMFACSAVIAIFFQAGEWERDRVQVVFHETAVSAFNAIERRFHGYSAVTKATERHFTSAGDVSPAGFRVFLEGIRARNPGTQALEWIAKVPAAERNAFEAERHSAGHPRFEITERNAANKMVRAGGRGVYFPVTYVEPLVGNERALGFDLGSSATRLKALEKARDTGRQVATARITLVQETGRQFGFLLFHPIFATPTLPDTLAARRTALRGFALGVFRIGEMIDVALREIDLAGIRLTVGDTNAAEGKRLLYSSEAASAGELANTFRFERVLSVADRRWKVEFRATAAYLARQRAWQAWLVLVGGLIFVGLLQAFLLSLTGRAARTERLVDRRTRDLRESEARVRAIVDNTMDAIITIDGKGIIQSANPATGSLFGYRIDDLIGRNGSMLAPEPHRSAHDDYLANYLRTGEAKIIGTLLELEGLHRNGTTLPIELRVSALEVGDEQYFLGAIRDISERREVDRVKGQFVSTVSHELRTPLTSIKGSLALVEAGALGNLEEDVQSLIGIARRNTERLINLVNDILDIDKLESGEMEFTLVEVDLAVLAAQSIESNAAYGKEHGVAFRLTAPSRPARARVDRARIDQVLANLLSNAAKFSPRDETVDITVDGGNGVVRIAVVDRGPGIDESFRDRIFERFTQADSSDTRQEGGTGLGLNISRAIIERHGGTINFESEPGQGATFFFELPAIP